MFLKEERETILNYDPITNVARMDEHPSAHPQTR